MRSFLEKENCTYTGPGACDKGAGCFHIHRKTMKDLWILAVVGVREQPNLAHNLVTHRH